MDKTKFFSKADFFDACGDEKPIFEWPNIGHRGRIPSIVTLLVGCIDRWNTNPGRCQCTKHNLGI